MKTTTSTSQPLPLTTQPDYRVGGFDPFLVMAVGVTLFLIFINRNNNDDFTPGI